MAFEQSPELDSDGIKSRSSLREMLARNERALYALTAILVVIVIVLSLRMLLISSSESGGLDGCITNAAGEPVIGTVRVDSFQRAISADGCFFFAELSPGSHDLFIEIADGAPIKQAVTVLAGQAVGLGTITVP